MKSVANTTRFSVRGMGELGVDLLQPGAQGHILAIFSKAIYLRSASDELLWLVTDDVPLHRRGIQIFGALPSVSAGSTYVVDGQHLLLAPDVDLDLKPASIWAAPRPTPGQNPPFEELSDRLRVMTRLFDELPSPTGFGSVFPEILRSAAGTPLPDALSDYGPILNHAGPALLEIVLACVAGDFPRILAAAEELIGLGEGLTPSGDDFLGGLLFTSLAIQEIYARYQGFNPSDVALLLDSSKNRTNLISWTMLKDHAAGHGSDTLHRFVNTLFNAQSDKGAHYWGLELTRIGHSTGWDLLSGVWTGALLAICSGATDSSRVSDYTSCFN